MRRVSEPILQALSKAVGINVSDSKVAVPLQLKQDILALSRQFTRGRSRTPLTYLDDPRLGSAYLTYFYLVNLAKVQVLLDELIPVIDWGDSDKVTRVLDLGCGPGTGIMGVVDWAASTGHCHDAGLHYVAVDWSAQALATCNELFQYYLQSAGPRRSRLWTLHCDLRGDWATQVQRIYPHSGYDLVILQNVLGEMFIGEPHLIQRRTAMVRAALSILSDRGTVMLIEPALRESSRALHQVRDNLLEANVCTLYSPCLHERSCPALARLDDWCHEERPWDPPIWIRTVDKAVGFIKDALKFSYVLLRKDGETVVKRGPDLYRVVSELRVLKGERRAWLCNEQGRPEVGRLDRLTSSKNAAVDDWHRGAIVRISEIVRRERDGKPSTVGRIQPDTSVEVIRAV
jgi:ribosomal protein RSM22 (predicted rRNA methylase)